MNYGGNGGDGEIWRVLNCILEMLIFNIYVCFIYIYIFLLRFFSIIGHSKILHGVPCAY